MFIRCQKENVDRKRLSPASSNFKVIVGPMHWSQNGSHWMYTSIHNNCILTIKGTNYLS